MRKIAAVAIVLALVGSVATGVSSAAPYDEAAIKATALDYIEGYYTGDAERMERALHPQLAKRIVMPGEGGHAMLDEMTAEDLVGITRSGGGTRTPEDKRRMEVEILDVYEGVASVRVNATDWVDYMHIGNVDGEWKIINVLWEFTPEAKARMSR